MMFEDLDAWQQARYLVNEIYSLTRENSSLSKDFGLKDQLQSAAVSIMSNVAEGFERTHLPEKIQFYNIARGSTGSNLSWEADLRPFAVDRETERQTATSHCPISYLLASIFR
jgi:hypothetical protein